MKKILADEKVYDKKLYQLLMNDLKILQKLLKILN